MARERKAQEPGYGFLFPKKDRGERDPNVTGRIRLTGEAIQAVLRGEELEVAGWTKTAASGVRYINLSVKHIPSSQDALPRPELLPPELRPGGATTEDDDIPF